MSAALGSLGLFASRRRGLVIGLYLAATAVLAALGLSIHLETSLAELLPHGTPSADDLRDLLLSEETVDRLLISLWLEPAAEDPEDDLPALQEAVEALAASLTRSGLIKEIRFGVAEEEMVRLARRAIDHLPVLIGKDRTAEAAARLEPDRVREAVARIRRAATMPGFVGPVKEMAAIDPLGLLPLVRMPTGTGALGLRPDPLTGLFLASDGRRLLAVVEATRPPTEIAFSRRLMEAVRKTEESLRQEVSAGSRLRFDHAGGHIVALEDERRVRHDAASTSLFSIAGIAAIYLFVIRRPALWAAILVPLVMSTVWTLGIASIYPGRLNMVTVAFAAILLGIGDDAMIHIYLREREERRRGTPAPASAAAALAGTGPAVIVATLTTAAAFFALSFVRFRGLAELGAIAGIGMLSLLAGALVFFPAALAFLARREEAAPAPSLRLPVSATLVLHDALARRRRVALAAAAAFTTAMAVAALGVRISPDLRSIRGEDPAAAALERLLAPFGSVAPETMVVIHGARAAAEGEAPDARIEKGLRAAAALEPFCREWAASGRIAGCDNPALATPPESIQRERFEALAGAGWPETAGLLESEARTAGMAPAFFGSFLGAARRYADWGAVRVAPEAGAYGPLGVPRTSVYFRDPRDAPEIASEVRRRLEGRPARIASVALVSADLGRVIAQDFRRAAWLVAAAIALISLAAFRRPRLSLLTMTPVVAGSVWMLGTARLAGIELNLMSLMSLPIVFGLGVDFGVYIVDRWARGGRDPRAALEGVGAAVLVTGLTTLAGFAALLSAELAGLRSLGIAVLLGTGCTLAAALVLLPLLLPPTGDHASPPSP